MIHISPDGNGDFKSLQAALDALPGGEEEQTLFLHKGVYRERITVRRPRLTLIGEEAASTILTGSLYARMAMADDGSKRGTFRTYSFFVDTHDFTARNLTFENAAGDGPSVGQALAVYADGDRLCFENCRFLGGQDTLFTAPLPPSELEPNGFIGPKQHAPRARGRHYYKNCYIEGDIDFIFGGAAAYFDRCTLFSKDIKREVNSFVTAASTPKGQEYGYVMDRCRFEGNCPEGSAYLGRPWRNYAKTVLINCFLGAHIRPEGWHDWDKNDARKTVFYAEYGSFGPGALMESRPDWVVRLSREELPRYQKERVLSGPDHWTP